MHITLTDGTQEIPLPVGGGVSDFHAAVSVAKKQYAGLFKRLTLKNQWNLKDDLGRSINLQEVFPRK